MILFFGAILACSHFMSNYVLVFEQCIVHDLMEKYIHKNLYSYVVVENNGNTCVKCKFL